MTELMQVHGAIRISEFGQNSLKHGKPRTREDQTGYAVSARAPRGNEDSLRAEPKPIRAGSALWRTGGSKSNSIKKVPRRVAYDIKRVLVVRTENPS